MSQTAETAKPTAPSAREPRPREAADGEGAIEPALRATRAARSKGTITVERTRTPRPRPAADELRFGRVFSDHMLMLEHDGARGWHGARVVPYGPLALDPASAGLHYGQSMFDGLKAFRGADGKVRIFRIDKHCRRLARGAARLCMQAPDPALMRDAILALVRQDRDWVPDAPGTALYLRPTLIATEPFLGVRPATEYLFFVIASPVGDYYGGGGGALRIWVEDRMVRAASGGLGAVKAAANYAASLRAAEDARSRGYAQVLWTDAAEHSAIEEVGTMNVFVDIGGEVATPPLDGTILAGVTRDSVITLLERMGRKVRERRITIQEIMEARRTGRLREMFGTGTGAAIAPVGELGWKDERIMVGDGGEGPLARRLLPMLREIQTGVAPDPDGWMTEV
jgi:branched-chain amino acid aminotransferase